MKHEKFGSYLKELRMQHNPPMTQEQLAEAIGRGKMTICQFEQGKNAPPHGELLNLIINALEIDEATSNKLRFLAAYDRGQIPSDIEEYFFNNPIIYDAIRIAMNRKEPVDWNKIAVLIGEGNE